MTVLCERDQINQACQGLREQLIAGCVQDLTTEIDPCEATTVTIQRAGHHLNEDQWVVLADTADRQLAAGVRPWEAPLDKAAASGARLR
ncbi:hypothetical protein [Mycobacteroides salmoniphilum]|uniref:hypothetical protein n=1 Tax=Mycobacteroides salmoniphilum TaxID=404941 RepID=UPI0010653BF3|nr:hypothetical protein [Mycobacteroides salmoniphilum]